MPVSASHHYYRVNAPALEPLHEWVTTFEQMWNDHFDRLEIVLAEMSATDPNPSHDRQSP